MTIQRRHWRWALALVGAYVCIWVIVVVASTPQAKTAGGAPQDETRVQAKSAVPISAPIDLERFIRGSEEVARLPVPTIPTCAAPTAKNVVFIGHYAPALPRFETTLASWKTCNGRTPKRVVIVSPDHQREAQRAVAVGERAYTWQGKTIEIDEERQKEALRLQGEGSPLFTHEHGVAVPLIAAVRVFPEIERVVPMVVSTASSESEVLRLAKLMQDWAEDPETLIIVSVDFSHYLPLYQARVHDQKTRTALQMRALSTLWRANDAMTDFGRGLWLLLSIDLQARVYIQESFSTVDLGGPDGYTTTFMTGWLAK